jgi:hypothetical protein
MLIDYSTGRHLRYCYFWGTDVLAVSQWAADPWILPSGRATGAYALWEAGDWKVRNWTEVRVMKRHIHRRRGQTSPRVQNLPNGFWVLVPKSPCPPSKSVKPEK